MVDPERLHRILRRISDDLDVLSRYADVPADELLRDAARLGHVKYLFITSIEGCLDAAHHLHAAEGWGPPGTNAEAMLLLARHGVLDERLATAMAMAVRFRNVLVHGYADVDDHRVIGYLGRLSDIEAFVRRFSALIEQ
jgi:uncharacterized protein YutE (UPF0331/DUF86 family)